jgi:hypothetical protein
VTSAFLETCAPVAYELLATPYVQRKARTVSTYETATPTAYSNRHARPSDSSMQCLPNGVPQNENKGCARKFHRNKNDNLIIIITIIITFA